MASDLKVDIDGIRLNIRCGAIMRYGDSVVIEISKEGRNSVVPGGRIKINERAADGLAREIKEEMNLTIIKEKLRQLMVFENFFTSEGKSYHEMYFLYEYNLSESEKEYIEKLTVNYDNATTYFKLVDNYSVADYNLLPIELHSIIQTGKV
jgi:ADP-ribose pyrophosphatase YjhB (NUDIX family)